MILPLFSLFSLYIETKQKKIQFFLTSQLQKQIDLETISVMLTCTVLQDRSLPRICTHTKARMHSSLAQSVSFSKKIKPPIFFPIISSVFSSQATFSLAANGKGNSTVLLCTSEPNHGDEASRNALLFKLSLIWFTPKAQGCVKLVAIKF